MKCDEARQRVITDYLEQSNRNLSDSLQAHLISCHDCRLYREDLNDIYRAFQREDRSSLPSKILRELKPIFKIGTQNRSLRRYLPKAKWVWIGSGVGVVLIFLLALPSLRNSLTEPDQAKSQQNGDGVGPESYAGGVVPQEVVKERAEQSPQGMVVEQTKEETFKSSFEQISEKLKKKMGGASLTREMAPSKGVVSQADKGQTPNSEVAKNADQTLQDAKPIEAITDAIPSVRQEEASQVSAQVLKEESATDQITDKAETETSAPAVDLEKAQILPVPDKTLQKKETPGLVSKQTVSSPKKFAIEQSVVGMPMAGGALQQAGANMQGQVLELKGPKSASASVANSAQDQGPDSDPCDLNQHAQESVESMEVLKGMAAVLSAQEPLGSSAMLDGIEPQGLVVMGEVIAAQTSASSSRLMGSGSSGGTGTSLAAMVQDLKEPLGTGPKPNSAQGSQPENAPSHEFREDYFMNYCQALPQDLELRP